MGLCVCVLMCNHVYYYGTSIECACTRIDEMKLYICLSVYLYIVLVVM